MSGQGEGDVFEAGAAVLEFVAEGLDLNGGILFFGGGHDREVRRAVSLSFTLSCDCADAELEEVP